jgi:hypothetical protein
MKRITTLFAALALAAFGWQANAQTLNQNAAWPNTAWTLSGTYTPAGLLNDPTLNANFTWDDDAAGNGSADAINAESPVIDLTAARNVGETWININGDVVYRALGGDLLTVEYWDADAANWVVLESLVGNSTNADYQTCVSTVAYTTAVLNIAAFSPTQLAGFKYRINYDDLSGWQWGWCLNAPTIVSSAPPSLDVVSGSPQYILETSFALVLSDPANQNFLVGSTSTYTAAIISGSTTYYAGSTNAYNGGDMSLNMAIGSAGTPAPGNYDVNLSKDGGVSTWSCTDCFQFVACPSFEELSLGDNGPYSSVGATIGINEVTPPAGSGNGQGCESQDGWCNSNNSPDEPGIQNTTWYTFVAPSSGSVTLNTDNSTFDTQIAVYEANTCVSLVDGSGTAMFIGGNYDNPNYINSPYSSELRLNCLTAGQTYYVQVDGFDGDTGDVMINLTDNGGGAVITGNRNVGENGMTIDFLASAGGEKRIIRYHEFGNSPNFSWKVLPADRSSGYINGLSPYTRYTVRVGTRCAGENALYGDTATFWTRAATCVTPIASATINGTTAVISWSSTNADFYKLRFRSVGGTWSYRNTDQNSVSINGSTAGDYEWQIRSVCSEGRNLPYSAIQTFTLGTPRLASLNANDGLLFNLYPNPTNGLVTIEFASSENETIILNVTDLTGKMVYNRSFASQKGSNRLSLDLTDLETGVYLTTLSNQAGISERVRIVLN